MTHVMVSRNKNKSVPPGIWTTAFDVLALGCLIFHFASLHGLSAYLLHLGSTQFISILTILFTLGYVFWNIRLFLFLSSFKFSVLMIFFVVVMPIVFSILQYLLNIQDSASTIYYSALFLMYGLLLIVAIILGAKNKRGTLMLLVVVTFAIVILAFAINYVTPSLVIDVSYTMSQRAGDIFQYDRIRGFFGHPNEAAIAVVMLAMLFGLFSGTGFGVPQFLVIIVAMALIFLTGSRTSLLLIVVLTALLIWRSFALEGIKYALKLSTVIPFVFTTIIFIGSILTALYAYVPSIANSLNRVTDLLDAATAGGGGQDMSYEIRLRLIGQYLNLVMDNVSIGIGFVNIGTLIDQQYLEEVSQISWIQWAAEFGIFYVILAALTFCSLFVAAFRAIKLPGDLRRYGYDMLIFLIITIIATLSLVDIFFVRAIVITSGLLIGRLAVGLRIAEKRRMQPYANAVSPVPLPSARSGRSRKEFLRPADANWRSGNSSGS